MIPRKSDSGYSDLFTRQFFPVYTYDRGHCNQLSYIFVLPIQVVSKSVWGRERQTPNAHQNIGTPPLGHSITLQLILVKQLTSRTPSPLPPHPHTLPPLTSPVTLPLSLIKLWLTCVCDVRRWICAPCVANPSSLQSQSVLKEMLVQLAEISDCQRRTKTFPILPDYSNFPEIGDNNWVSWA